VDEVVTRARSRAAGRRGQLIRELGSEVARFQEESGAFDEAASQVLALDRRDLPCMTMLLFGGPATVDRLAGALHASRLTVSLTIARLELAGYARRRPGGRAAVVELTEHAREWIARIWAPLGDEGARLMADYSTRDLATMLDFLCRARGVQERHLSTLRTWLLQPQSRRRPHLRGGLAPAALRRVEVFVEANLEHSIRLHDLAARAGLSLHHFARAFRTSTGVTPREFVEQRRFERARSLIDEGQRSLADIAVICGFGTQSRLTTVFRRRTGFTPAEFRRLGVPH
jgi:AraC family transcriptional regulator